MFSFVIYHFFYRNSLHLVVSTIISIVGIVLAATWPESKKCEAYFIMIYMRCAWWLLTLV